MPLTLRITGNTVKAVGRTIKIDNYIDRVTRFQPKGYEHSDKYQAFLEGEKKDVWDGWVHLYDAREGTFPLGLIEDVKEMLCVKDIEYIVTDERKFRKFEPLHITYCSSLRDYQIEAVVKAIEAKRGVICCPTGSGKSLAAVALIAELKMPAVWYVHKKELLYQTKELLEREFKMKIGQVGDGVIDIKPITVAMVQTANRLPRQLFTDFGVVIFDECQHCPADMVYDIAKCVESPFVVGLSATPRREDGKELLIWAATGPICANISTSDLIERGFLARPYIDYIEVDPIPISRYIKYQDIYKKAIVFNDDRNSKIALKAVELAAKGKVYCHVKRVVHGELLTTLINDLLPRGYPKAEFIYGQDTTQTRQRVINAFRKKDLRILVSTLLGEGMDLPEMYALILASGGLSRTFVQQVFGRVLRGSVHKEVEFWDCNDPVRILYDHFIERVRFYKSEPSFMLSPKLEKIEVPDSEEK